MIQNTEPSSALQLEELLQSGHADKWEMVDEMIRSEQIPLNRVLELVMEYPAFAEWRRNH